jgi:hypothetical protein
VCLFYRAFHQQGEAHEVVRRHAGGEREVSSHTQPVVAQQQEAISFAVRPFDVHEELTADEKAVEAEPIPQLSATSLAMTCSVITGW